VETRETDNQDGDEPFADGGGVNFLLIADNTSSSVKLKINDLKQYLMKYSQILETKIAMLLKRYVHVTYVVVVVVIVVVAVVFQNNTFGNVCSV
jgi:hypothetical protein